METILLVDDEYNLRKSFKIGLMHRGYAVLEASDGREALEKLSTSKHRIDMVITDYSMPGMDGLELLAKIRKKSGDIPVIMITAYGQKSLVIEALRNQCDSFIEKPLSLDELILEIERIRHKKLSNPDSRNLAKHLPRLIHHVNNPLMAISGHAQLGMSSLHDQKRLKKYFESINKAVDEIQNINRDIAQLGLFSPQGEVQMEDINLGHMIDDCLELFQGLADLKRVQVLKKFQDQQVIIHGFPWILEQAFKNLILNALDAMDDRPVKRLELRIKLDREKSKVLIHFEDTGCGIPLENRGRIFEPYFTSKTKGTGLGLAIVKEAVDAHHGGIFVESQVNKGTIFIIKLPLGGSDPQNRSEQS